MGGVEREIAEHLDEKDTQIFFLKKIKDISSL